MTDDRSDRGDGRDAKGRWTKDTSGNPNGRPPNVPDLDMSDAFNFSRFPTEIAIGGEKQLLTRYEIVWFKMFESALKGRITAQKYLIEKFEQAQYSRDEVRFMLEKWAERYADEGGPISSEVMHLIRAAEGSLELRRSMVRTRPRKKRKPE